MQLKRRLVNMQQPTTVKELKQHLETAIDEFSAGIHCVLDDTDDETMNREALEDVARHAFYTFIDFKNHIVKYLEAAESRQS